MRTTNWQRLLAVSFLSGLCLFGCATTGPATSSAPGHLDSRLAQAARSDTAREMELVMSADGAIGKISVNDKSTARVSDALKKLVEEKFPGAAIFESELEIYADAGLVHEVEVKTAEGKECEVSMSDAGAFRYTECQQTQAELPAPVAKALEATAPNPELHEAEIRKSADGSSEYRIEVSSGGRKWYLRFSVEGALIERSIILAAELRIPVK